MTTRIQYSRDQLREIERVVAPNPKRYLQRPAPRQAAPEPERRSRFERPAGYQGRLGRDRDTETFEEGYQYEMNHRLQSGQAGPVTASQPAPSTRSPEPTQQRGEQLTDVKSAVPTPADDFAADLLAPVVPPPARKSRFNFSEPISATPQPTVAAAPVAPVINPQPVINHVMPMVIPQPQGAFPANAQFIVAQPGLPYGTYVASVPPFAGNVESKPMQNTVPKFQPQPQPQQQPQPAHVSASFTVTPGPQQTHKGEFDVMASLKKQGVDPTRHQYSQGQNVNATRPNNRHSHGSSAQPVPQALPDPAIVSFSASGGKQPISQGPPALQALFNGSNTRGPVSHAPPAGAMDAAALEASLMVQTNQGRPGSSQHHGHRGGNGSGRRR